MVQLPAFDKAMNNKSRSILSLILLSKVLTATFAYGHLRNCPVGSSYFQQHICPLVGQTGLAAPGCSHTRQARRSGTVSNHKTKLSCLRSMSTR